MSDDFLSRWSKRKRRTDAEAVPPDPAAAEPEEQPAPEESDEELLARIGLKHPDEMGPGDDFAAFVRAAVPRHLKTLAYRRLWRSNPTLACLDGLNDYDDDFTGTGVAEGGLKTAYQVGRGLLGRISEVAENQRTDVLADPEKEDGPTHADGPESDEAPQDEPEDMQSTEMMQQNDTFRTARRRMVFRTKG